MKTKEGVLLGLLGVIAGLLLVLTFQLNSVPPAQGQTSSGVESSGWIMATGIIGGNSSACWLYNTKDNKLVLYKSQGTNLTLVATRLCTFDMQVVQYTKNNQRPSVLEMQRNAKGKGKKSR